MKYSILLLALATSLPTYAAGDVPPNVPKNIRYQAAPACQASRDDWEKFEFRFNGLSMYNDAVGTVATAICTPLVDVSDNGTDEVGLFISNNDGGTTPVTATCFMTYNTAGQGARYAEQSVTVQPGLIKRVGWNTENIVFGGPVTFVCLLPYKAGVMRVYTISQHSS